MIESEVRGIFPTPIYMSKLNRELTKKEITFIDKSKLDSHNNEVNITSNNNYILNNLLFTNFVRSSPVKLLLKSTFPSFVLTTAQEDHL